MHFLASLAKAALEEYVINGKFKELSEDFPEEFLEKRAGVFVTVEKTGSLRGCIGTYLPTRINIGEEIIRNAVAAAIEDYRFSPIKKEELRLLSYAVYVLGYPEPVQKIEELDPQRFGIVVKTGPLVFPNEKDVVFNGVVPYKTGLLLPALEGIDTPEKQISIACQKGGIDLENEKIFIYKFTVKKYE